MSRSPFSGIEDADVGGSREPFLIPNNVRRDLALPKEKNIVHAEPAEYYLRVDACEFKGTRKAGDFWKSKFTIVAGNGPNAVGSVAVWMVPVRSDGFKRDVKTFVCTAMNYDPARLTESDTEAVVSRAQPLTANKRYMRVIVDNVKTKEKGNDFTRHEWHPLDAVFNPDGSLASLNPPAIDQVAEYVKRKGEIK